MRHPTLLMAILLIAALACSAPVPTATPVPTAAPAPTAPADAVVAFENPNETPEPMQEVPAVAADQPADPAAINWTERPHASDQWAIAGAGTLPEGMRLYNPFEDELPPFAVYYRGHTEPMVVLLPDDRVWDTDDTVAPMSFEFEGQRFQFEAYSPLLGDVGDLDLHLLGYRDGEHAVLAVVPIE